MKIPAKASLLMLPAMAMILAVTAVADTPSANTPTASAAATTSPAATTASNTTTTPVTSVNAPAASAGTANTANDSPQAIGDTVHPTPGTRNPRYKICRDDVLTLTFPIAPEFNQKITVMPDGYVNLQGAGSLYILGMTVPEAVEAMKKAYTGVLHEPIIEVDLTDFQKPYFVVLGQVGKPGQYDLRYDMTITQAVAVAGGFAPTAKTQLLYYHPVSSSMMEVKKLNIKDVLNGKNVNEEVHLQPGDMIFVPEKAITKFRKYVPYSLGAGVYPAAAF